jgi:negative regulator of sigma-B (phosphoserine phosphatase)
MTTTVRRARPQVDVGAPAGALLIRSVDHRTVPREGESLSGDVVVVRHDADVSLLAVVDALGHGAHAAVVATTAQEWLATASLVDGVESLLTGLHGALRGSRGACVLLCLVSHGAVSGCSVGNVDMRWLKTRPPFVMTPGVVGHRIDRPRIFKAPATPGERVVIFSDGISARFDVRATATLSTADACHAIFSQHRRSHDDATVLVADFQS